MYESYFLVFFFSIPPLKSKHISKDPRSLTTKFWRMSNLPEKKKQKCKEREKRVLLFLYIFGPSLIYFAYQKCLFTLFMFFSSSHFFFFSHWAALKLTERQKIFVVEGFNRSNKLINSFDLSWSYWYQSKVYLWYLKFSQALQGQNCCECSFGSKNSNMKWKLTWNR